METEKAENITSAPEPTAEQDAAVDKLLADIVSDDDPDESFAEDNEEQPESEPTEDVEEEEESTPEPTQNPEGEKARKNLKLSGVPEKLLKSLSDEEAVEWWTRQAKREADANAAFRRRAELERELEGLKATKETEPEAEPTVKLDLSSYQANLADQFGDDGAEAMVQMTRTAIQEATKPLAEVKAYVQTIGDAFVEMLVDQSMSELGLVDLDSADTDRVRQRFDELRSSSLHRELSGKARVKALLQSASRMELDLPSPAEKTRQEKVRSMKERGKLHPSTPKSPAKGLTEEEIIDRKAAMAASGASADEIRAKYGG